MRHVLSSSSLRSPLFLLQPAFSPYPTILPTSRGLFTSPSLPIRKRTEKILLQTTSKRQIPPKTPGTAGSSESGQAEPLRSTKVTDTAASGLEKQNTSPVSPKEAPALVDQSIDLKALKILRRAWKVQETVWKILNPALPLECYERRSTSPNPRMRSEIQFITTPTADTPGTALFLNFDDRRYLIGNAHEGLSRATLQTGTRILKLKDILLTGKTEWKSNGGLMGMILNIADASNSSAASKLETARMKLRNRRLKEELNEQKKKKKKKNVSVKLESDPSQNNPTPAKKEVPEEDPTVRIHGGVNLAYTLATARSFIYRKGTPIKVLEHIGAKQKRDEAERDWEPTWSDHRIKVWAMQIKPSGISKLDEDLKPESPRKRSLGEFMSGLRPGEADVLNPWSVKPAPLEDQDEKNRQIRDLAVSEMFSSAWSRDDLVETPLRDVKMPAALHIRDPVTKELIRYKGPTPGGTALAPDMNVWVRRPWPGALIDHLPCTKRSLTAMSYIIRNHSIRGKFMTDAVEKLQVPRGPMWAALAAGSSVLSSDGRTVTPDMVLGPGKDGSGVAVIDLPSKDYVHELVERPEWGAAQVMHGVEAIVWILGPGVIQDKSLIKFIEGQTGVEHIISSPEYCPNYLSMDTAATMALRHHQIDPARYPIPLHSNVVSSISGELSDAGDMRSETMPEHCRPARRGLKIQLEPKFDVVEEAVTPFLNTDLVTQDTPQDALDLSRAAREKISTPAVQAETRDQNIPSPDAEIICLGTGSATPSQHRNVAATLLRVPGCGSYLMDCGENTLGQLKRMYTAPQLAEVFHDLKLIWFSHLHADHHLGAASLIKAWYEVVHGEDEVKRRRPTVVEQILDPVKLLLEGRRLFVVGHQHMIRWLEEYSCVEDFGFDQLVPLVSNPSNGALGVCNLMWNGENVGFYNSKSNTKSAMRRATGLSSLNSCFVSHCKGAQAVSLTFPTGFKFSYSGDCRPSASFAKIGKDSTVLLHEATFDDELKSDAVAKKHSTTSEALGVSVAMGARRVILTHFSQRYQKVPSISTLDTCSVKLEDAEDIDNQSLAMDQPVDEPTDPVQSQAPTDKVFNTPDVRAETIASDSDLSSRPRLHDMRVGVAFDYMRVKVGDIMHLDRFTPALMELYKDADEAKDNKTAREAFSDDEDDILQKEQHGKAKKPEKRSPEERAERARRGQIKAARRLNENGELRAEERGEADGKGIVGEQTMEEVEMTEPVAEEMKAVQ